MGDFNLLSWARKETRKYAGPGEGSRGGQVVGHSASGKAIYDRHARRAAARAARRALRKRVQSIRKQKLLTKTQVMPAFKPTSAPREPHHQMANRVMNDLKKTHVDMPAFSG